MEWIKPAPKTLSIAEIGVNHNGYPNLANNWLGKVPWLRLKFSEQLSRESGSAGAVVVKFQTLKAELLATKDTPKATHKKSKDENNDLKYHWKSNLMI